MQRDMALRKCGERWEYIAVYIDDLGFSMEDPKSLID